MTGGGKRARTDPSAADITGDPLAVYNPHYNLAPHCLYACALTIARIEPTLDNIMLLRDAVGDLLATAMRGDLIIAGWTVASWAHHLQFAAEEFVLQTSNSPFRLGNALDGYLASLILGCSIWIYD
eukprot:4252062-Amphidinium_carterae.3